MNEYDVKEIENEVYFNQMMFENYIPVNVWLIRSLGLNAALMLAKLYEEYLYRRKINKIKWRDAFDCSIIKVSHDTGLSKAQQAKAIDILVHTGIISKYTVGLKKKRCFRINFNKYNSLQRMFDEVKIKYDKEYAKRVEDSAKIDARLQEWVNKEKSVCEYEPPLESSSQIDINEYINEAPF